MFLCEEKKGRRERKGEQKSWLVGYAARVVIVVAQAVGEDLGLHTQSAGGDQKGGTLSSLRTHACVCVRK